jgi:hypothetical protein
MSRVVPGTDPSVPRIAGEQATRYWAATSTSDRLDEIAEVLALGLQRLLARKSSQKSAHFGESSLHFAPDQSGAGSPNSGAEKRS